MIIKASLNCNHFEYLPVKYSYFIVNNCKLESNPTSNIGLCLAIQSVIELLPLKIHFDNEMKEENDNLNEDQEFVDFSEGDLEEEEIEKKPRNKNRYQEDINDSEDSNYSFEAPVCREEFVSKLREVAWRSWPDVNINTLQQFTKAFQIDNEYKGEENKNIDKVIIEIKAQINQNNFKRAGVMTLAFGLQNHPDLDISNMINLLIKIGKQEFAVKLINSKETAVEIAHKLDVRKFGKIVSQLIKKYKLDPFDFPKLIRNQKFLHLRSFVKRHDWMKAEEIAQAYDQGLSILVDVLIGAKKYSEALSVIQRNAIDSISDYAQKGIESNRSKIVNKENILFNKDLFGPTEVVLKGASIEEYLLLKDFGIKEEDVWFIDSESDPRFEIAIEKFKNAKVVN